MSTTTKRYDVKVSPELARALIKVNLVAIPELDDLIHRDDFAILREWIDIKRALREELT